MSLRSQGAVPGGLELHSEGGGSCGSDLIRFAFWKDSPVLNLENVVQGR